MFNWNHRRVLKIRSRIWFRLLLILGSFSFSFLSACSNHTAHSEPGADNDTVQVGTVNGEKDSVPSGKMDPGQKQKRKDSLARQKQKKDSLARVRAIPDSSVPGKFIPSEPVVDYGAPVNYRLELPD